MSIIFQGFNDPFLRDAVKKIADTGVEVTAIVTSRPALYRDQTPFSKSEIIDEVALIKESATTAIEIGASAPVLDRSLLEKFVGTELKVLGLSDRNTYFQKSVKFRKRIYYRLLRYWLNAVDGWKPTAVVFANTPHSVESIVLHDIAVDRNIPILIIERTNIDDRILLKSGITSRKKVPDDFAARESLADLTERVNRQYGTNVFGKNRWEIRSIAINSEALGFSASRASPGIVVKIRNRLRKTLEVLTTLGKRRENVPAVFLDGVSREPFLRFLRAKNSFKQRALESNYRRRAIEADLSKKYVYFPLHFQPERTTAPLGGVFEDQIMAIRILAASIPSDWLIYVKEHPRQFDRGSYYSLQQTNYRDVADYESLLALENVRLIDLDSSTDRLIERSEIVATITGTSGWQAMTLGIPVLCFGHPSYVDCPAALSVDSVESCRSAVQASLKMTPETVKKDFLRYLAFIEPDTVVTAHSESAVSGSALPREELTRNLSEAITSKIRVRTAVS